jgi:RES domain-containing protein
LPTAWRIVKKRDARSAFDGQGARLFGGRWNSPGIGVVYIASTRSLAALEMAVHLDRATLLASFVLIPCTFHERLVTALDYSALPHDWRRDPAPSELALMGDAWVRSGQSAILAVPSAIVAEEVNFLLNPAHPDFHEIAIGRPETFDFDPRLLK